ncbi:tRNA (adenine(58)-N(1))-methyltransferase catalytic subunit trmt61a-like [Lolium rigidum]|uniref:tRNA (adenine(58)-N(1))-methyltransferase catalytic subunit trmt61a-like n=1 Tax=Lolium rigidum TaxID=89674 RepID=UPI001F5D4B73|nr:tRNA (adenine(58)-N(1))-methyltransferase catalytic subunit trmt61a-like [Lolium rigidum]
MMVPLDPSDKPTSQRRIAVGDTVVVYERHDAMRAVTVAADGVLQNRFGVFRHADWLGRHFGSKVFSSAGGGGGGKFARKAGGGFVHLLAPTPELWTLVLSHRTQILYIADISLVVAYLELVPGCVVLESGTGSGSLTTSLARAVAPQGHVYTFDFHDQRAASAREDFEKNGLSSLITVAVRDIQGEGFPDEHSGAADAVFLDLPQPWLAIPSAGTMLRQDGVLCSFSPCIEQVQRACEAMRSCFTDIRTFEILLRTYDVHEGVLKSATANEAANLGSVPEKKRKIRTGGEAFDSTQTSSVMARPCSTARGHTGYLTFARRSVHGSQAVANECCSTS